MNAATLALILAVSTPEQALQEATEVLICNRAIAQMRETPQQARPGYHRHITRDGKIIEHHDSNYGNPEAHRNVAYPWPKYYGPVQRCPT